MKLAAWLALGVLGGIAVGAAACGSDVTDSPPGSWATTTSSSSGQGGGGGGATTGTSTTGTGQGGATSTGTTTGQGGAGGGSGQGGAGGGAACLGCSDVLNGGDPNAICTMNGPPSSSDLLASMVDCLCVTGCVAECGDNACMGSQASQACQGCALNACGNEVQACLGDSSNPPPCVSCDDVLNGGDPAALCTMNGPPSSSDLWDAFSTCACVDSCSNECGAACQGGQPDQACLGCVQQSCGAELQACTSDGAPPPPVCETCGGALQGGDPANLCTMNGPPSSQEIFDAFTQCTCVDSCANQCAGACNGGQPSNACQSCINNQCGAELDTCLADM